MRSAMIVIASRYSTRSISLAIRPCPGMMRVPPIELYSGIAMSIRRFRPSSTPFIVPPCLTSITGYRSVEKMSPATITSDLRKNTIRSPSVWAAG